MVSSFAILAGILRPAVPLARESAKATVCRNNLRQEHLRLLHALRADGHVGAAARNTLVYSNITQVD